LPQPAGRCPQISFFENRLFGICLAEFMPTYEYVCSKCGHAFEKVQSIKANALTVCPRDVCPQKPWGKGKVQRRIGMGGGLIFKGSGFYETDYRSENYKAAEKKEAAAQTPAKTESKAGTTTESAAPKATGSDSAAKSGPSPSAAAVKEK
jgi:putative FmdB family regulatory protein